MSGGACAHADGVVVLSVYRSMQFIGVATFSVLRYLQPCFSVPIDYLVSPLHLNLCTMQGPGDTLYRDTGAVHHAVH